MSLNRELRFALAMSILLFLTESLMRAEAPPTYYQFHPISFMSLGSGFSLEDLTEPKARCVEFEPDPLDPGSLSSGGVIYMATNSEQLRNALSVDTSVDVSYLTYKASAHYGFSQENLFSSSDVTLVIRFTAEYGRLGLKNEHLTPAASNLLNQGKLSEFKAECGTRLVSTEHLGASAAVIVTLHQVDSSVKNQFSTSLSGGLDLAALSGSVKASLTREMNQANSERRLSIQVVSTGGDGFGGLSDLIKTLGSGGDADVLNGVITALSEYIRQFNKTNAAPIGFNVGAMLGWSAAQNDLWSVQKDQLLGVLVDEYRGDDADLRDMRQIAAGADPRSQVYSAAEMDQIKKATDPLSDYMGKLAQSHEKCKAATTNDLTACTLPLGKPALPSFFGPIVLPSGSFILVVDGQRWSNLQSRAVFEDPGGGSLLERTRRRQPGAQSVSRVFVINGKLLDAALLVGTDREIYQVLVFYPKNSPGTSPFDGPNLMDLIVADPDKGDVSLLRAIRAYALHYQCTAPVVPGPPHYNIYAGRADVYLRARDIFGQTVTLKLANGKYEMQLSTVNPPAIGIALAVPTTNESGWSANYPLIGSCGKTFREFYELNPGKVRQFP